MQGKALLGKTDIKKWNALQYPGTCFKFIVQDIIDFFFSKIYRRQHSIFWENFLPNTFLVLPDQLFLELDLLPQLTVGSKSRNVWLWIHWCLQWNGHSVLVLTVLTHSKQNQAWKRPWLLQEKQDSCSLFGCVFLFLRPFSRWCVQNSGICWYTIRIVVRRHWINWLSLSRFSNCSDQLLNFAEKICNRENDDDDVDDDYYY